MLGVGLFSFMSGVWASPLVTGTRLVDVNGTTLSVGQTVKLVGTITVLNDVGPHFDCVTLQLDHPNGNGPLARKILKVDPEQLVVGS